MKLDKERLLVLAEAVKDWSDYNQYQHPGEFLKLAEFYVAASPAAVLALLSENAALAAEVERTSNNRDMWKAQCAAQAKELERLRKDERDACAVMCDQQAESHELSSNTQAVKGCDDCAAAIRARGSDVAAMAEKGGVHGPLIGCASPPTAQAEGWTKPHRTVTYVCPVCCASLERKG